MPSNRVPMLPPSGYSDIGVRPPHHLHCYGYSRIPSARVPHKLCHWRNGQIIGFCVPLLLRPHEKDFLKGPATRGKICRLYDHLQKLPRTARRAQRPHKQEEEILHRCWWDFKLILHFEFLLPQWMSKCTPFNAWGCPTLLTWNDRSATVSVYSTTAASKSWEKNAGLGWKCFFSSQLGFLRQPPTPQFEQSVS